MVIHASVLGLHRILCADCDPLPAQSQYAAASNVPLIKSPSLRVPPPVVLPPDIHPLPDSVTAYVPTIPSPSKPVRLQLTLAQFVYPFTLEPHVLSLAAARRNTLEAHSARRDALLRARADARNERARAALARIAPGFEPQGALLVPVRKVAALAGSGTQHILDAVEELKEDGPKDAMAALVDGLAAMDSGKGS